MHLVIWTCLFNRDEIGIRFSEVPANDNHSWMSDNIQPQ